VSDPLSRFVHVHVPAPTGSTEPRTLLLLHGTGGTERDLLEIGAAVAPGARLLGVRGQVLEGNMPRFFRRLAEGVFDEVDLVQRAYELAEFIPAAAEAYEFDPSSVLALGYSNGANIAAALLLLHPRVLSGAVLFRAMVPLVPAGLPDLDGVPVLLVEGEHDPIVPSANAERLAALLGDSGAAVSLHWARAAHGLTPADVDVARRWMANRP
jgi:phospholipase/carboxylesterase